MATTFTPPTEVLIDWQQQANSYLLHSNYTQAAQLYEQAIEAEPNTKLHYWHLGLLYLLQGQEEEAQTTWLFALSESDPEQVDQAVFELTKVLQAEAERREALEEYSIAWAIRQHLREFCPNNIDNLLWLVLLSIELDLLSDNTLEELQLIKQLTIPQTNVQPDLLLLVLDRLLENAVLSPSLLAFAEACINRLQKAPGLLGTVLLTLIRFGGSERTARFAIKFAEHYLAFDPDNIEVLGLLSPMYQNEMDYDRGIQVAKKRYQLSECLPEKIFSNYLLLRGLLGAGGFWQEAIAVAQNHEVLLRTLIEQQPNDLNYAQLARLINAGYYLVYLNDQPRRWRFLQNQLLEFCQNQIQAQAAQQGKQYQHKKRNRITKSLKIGYLSHCMATHSVGWLARWLLQHHDHERFEVHGYFLNYRNFHDPLQEWFTQQVDQAHKFGTPHNKTYLEVADQIYQDEIDILIDLDSITLDLSCEVLALKPAPVQVTWLGWDASGLPAIDYYIADPYVLPDSAQDYYSEKIWRLPQSYIAVDGFEVGVPTLRREALNIPEKAIVFLSAQRGYKRHRDHVKLQMQIIKQVPNSYFLIKGLSDENAIQKFFLEIAEEEGVESDRLRFLSGDPSSQVHRANLAIADVVLDTFPYNGATTTLETLWMGIPIVTRVGEQFAARNSYTMMLNAGVTEGIAWTDEEYVNWGVRLGTDAELRKQIHWTLHRSRQTSPLWNSKAFARQMEEAYEEMYALYQSKNDERC